MKFLTSIFTVTCLPLLIAGLDPPVGQNFDPATDGTYRQDKPRIEIGLNEVLFRKDEGNKVHKIIKVEGVVRSPLENNDKKYHYNMLVQIGPSECDWNTEDEIPQGKLWKHFEDCTAFDPSHNCHVRATILGEHSDVRIGRVAAKCFKIIAVVPEPGGNVILNESPKNSTIGNGEMAMEPCRMDTPKFLEDKSELEFGLSRVSGSEKMKIIHDLYPESAYWGTVGKDYKLMALVGTSNCSRDEYRKGDKAKRDECSKNVVFDERCKFHAWIHEDPISPYVFPGEVQCYPNSV